ncbi:arginyl-tRNA synthetase [Thecamonas trahens ATCC 50062]|uniref:arginine--tRNA ligase n=1 Tax=Thecamonas trahens ATCC 50062 TaxID=461836 RepID=A0A0L0DG97_THETB|nr:arginyl-tRNA synthetase [Thecamonas trahens ATCC 50062]KNC50368.1 arginyl-tRNA synthetase [Thecamonas trahens ATCC 50062]|eukprot:XP_013756910.1 arginyl-tRNA synthetase [Thecamonas trahens ATCC 50062]
MAPSGRSVPPLAAPTTTASQADLAVPAGFALAGADGLPSTPDDVARILADSLMRDMSDVVDDAWSVRGFVNLRLTNSALWSAVAGLGERSGLAAATQSGDVGSAVRGRVLIDAGSPNMGKILHVGHMRSYIFGAALEGLHRLAGANAVDVVSHEGDFGTPMGITLAQLGPAPVLRKPGSEDRDALGAVSQAYADGKRRLDAGDAAFGEAVQATTLRLQHALVARARLAELDTSERALLTVYDEVCGVSRRVIDSLMSTRLGLGSERRPESSYAAMLPDLVEKLKQVEGAREEDGGGWGIETSGFAAPFLFSKANGGYLYATTDVAALATRLAASPRYSRMVYVTDGSQAQHFAQLFAVSSKASQVLGGSVEGLELRHASFGMVRASPGSGKLSSRAGVQFEFQLEALLDAAEKAATASLQSGDDPRRLAVAALKYYDLLRPRGYVLDFDDMVKSTGKTAVYVLYARARALSLLAKAEREPVKLFDGAAPALDGPSRQLALALLGMPAAVRSAASACAPHTLAGALHNLAGEFHTWYSAVRVVGSPR